MSGKEERQARLAKRREYRDRSSDYMQVHQVLQALVQQLQALKAGLQQIVSTREGKRVLGIQKVRDKAGRMIAGRVVRADGSQDDIPIH
jgi:hypothetical protein